MSLFSVVPLNTIFNCAFIVGLVQISDYIFEDQRITRGMYVVCQNFEILFGITSVLPVLAKETWSESDKETLHIISTTWAFKVVYAYWKFGSISLWMDEEWRQLLRDKAYDYLIS